MMFMLWVLAAVVVASFWVDVISTSIRAFTAPLADSGPDQATTAAAGGLAMTVVAIVAQIGFLVGIVAVVPRVRVSHRLHRLPVPPEPIARRRISTAAIFAAAALMAAVAFEGPRAVPRPAGNDADGTARLFGDIRTLLAGFAEEPFFAMLPVLVLAMLPARWCRGQRGVAALTCVVAVSAIGRGAMHMHQGGWPAAAAVFWGAATVYAYYRFRAITGLIAVHTLWNVVAITQYGGTPLDRSILIGLAVLAAGFVVAVTWLDSTPTRSDREESEPAPESVRTW
ncbi:type II CAAX prenyl endopeptidase Rce1 family protein [Nocardia asteroides]|uniref:CPBP family glutamic-type intramembrane protease n=1 Tax=Nocardia asteroides TaxID=1824 RepID=UPI0037CC2E15